MKNTTIRPSCSLLLSNLKQLVTRPTIGCFGFNLGHPLKSGFAVSHLGSKRFVGESISLNQGHGAMTSIAFFCERRAAHQEKLEFAIIKCDPFRITLKVSRVEPSTDCIQDILILSPKMDLISRVIASS